MDSGRGCSPTCCCNAYFCLCLYCIVQCKCCNVIGAVQLLQCNCCDCCCVCLFAACVSCPQGRHHYKAIVFLSSISVIFFRHLPHLRWPSQHQHEHEHLAEHLRCPGEESAGLSHWDPGLPVPPSPPVRTQIICCFCFFLA